MEKTQFLQQLYLDIQTLAAITQNGDTGLVEIESVAALPKNAK
ncbi:hypothetical protein QUF73_03215 [Cytobacillus sp. NJ13]|nr:hypothetical protein [Cytobacillus sp. NJ13]